LKNQGDENIPDPSGQDFYTSLEQTHENPKLALKNVKDLHHQ